MAYDEELADRIRTALASEADVVERRMFGGLAFLVDGHMALAASREGGIMVRVDPEESDALLDLPGVSTVVMRGRPTHNWVRARGDDVATEDGLAVWIERGLAVIGRLPPRS